MNEGKMTVNQYTNVKDIKETFLYTKNGYLMAYIKVNKINIALLRKEEKEERVTSLQHHLVKIVTILCMYHIQEKLILTITKKKSKGCF